MSIRKWVIISSVILLIVVMFVSAIMYTSPKKHDLSLPAVIYQLGEQNKQYEQQVTLNIKGELKKSLLGKLTFTGEIDIEGESIPVPKEKRSLVLKFDRQGQDDLFYRYNDRGAPKHFAYGSIFVNKDFTELTITKYHDEDEQYKHEAWSSDSGYMISAPAYNRSEALTLSKKLMKHYTQQNKVELQ